MGYSESDVIAILAEVFEKGDPRVIVGIGDDAALVRGSAHQILTTDIAVEGVHFRREWSTPYEIGRRIAAANIADVLSMNGKCDYLLVAATLTGKEDLDWIRALAQGIADEAAMAGAVVVGGDLVRSPIFTLAITAVGHSEKVIERKGAAIGDGIYLSSLTGWSTAGLEILSGKHEITSPNAHKALAEYRAPTLDLTTDFSQASSMCDVSDSLMTQGRQMASASGVRFEINFNLIKASDEFADLSHLAQEVGGNLHNWILQGGEDHVLMATGIELPGLCIGRVVEGEGLIVIENGREIEMAPVAWSHFS
jgi:thiamine-monophosphate kinase